MGSRKKRKSVGKFYGRRRNKKRKQKRVEKYCRDYGSGELASEKLKDVDEGEENSPPKPRAEKRSDARGGQGGDVFRFTGDFSEQVQTHGCDVSDKHVEIFSRLVDASAARIAKKLQSDQDLSRHELRYIENRYDKLRAEQLRRDEGKYKRDVDIARLSQREREIELRKQKARELPGEVQEAIGESNGVDCESNASGGESGTFKGKKNTVGPSNYKKLPAEERAALMDWLKDLSKREGGAK